MPEIILLTGIHGVGKKFISTEIKKHIEIPIYSASSLIRLNNYKSDDNKKVDDIDKNQEQLMMNIKNYVKEDLIILDSHTCLLDKHGDINEIDNKWLNCLNIIGVIVLRDEPDVIKKRLAERDKLNLSINFLKKFDECELKKATELSELLNVSLLEFKNGDDISKLINYIVTIK